MFVMQSFPWQLIYLTKHTFGIEVGHLPAMDIYSIFNSIFNNDLSASCACTLGQQPHVALQQMYTHTLSKDVNRLKSHVIRDRGTPIGPSVATLEERIFYIFYITDRNSNFHLQYISYTASYYGSTYILFWHTVYLWYSIKIVMSFEKLTRSENLQVQMMSNATLHNLAC